MSALARRAELAKLQYTVHEALPELPALQGMSAAELRILRVALWERWERRERVQIRGLLALARYLPGWLLALFAPWLFGAPVVARLAGELPARQAVAVAMRLSLPMLANVCQFLDPRCARDLIQRLPAARIVQIALELLARRDYATMGRFVDYLSDSTIKAVLEKIYDDEQLLRIAYFMESASRLDHIVRLLPAERLQRLILLGRDPRRDILIELMSLVVNVSYSLQRELGDLAVEQDEGVLVRIIHEAEAEGLWGDLLPVLGNLSSHSQRKVVNLNILREEPVLLESILRTAEQQDLWCLVLPLVEPMEAQMRQEVARLAAALPRGTLARISEAALLGEHWPVLIAVVAYMPEAKQAECADIVKAYGVVDPELVQRIAVLAERVGMGRFFAEPQDA